MSAAERETIMQIDDESNTWKIWTLQGKIITKLKRVGIEPDQITPDGAHMYESVPFSQVSFRAESKRVYTDEQRQELSDRAKKNFGRKDGE